MKGEKNDIKFSVEEIRKYLDGQLTDQEMQALEKAALEDPFLSDAIEGIGESRNHASSFESGVADLQNRLTQRIREKNSKSSIVLLFSNWKIAASVIFILGFTALIITYINKSHRSEIAKSFKNDSGIKNLVSPPANKRMDTSAKSSSVTLSANSDSDNQAIVSIPHAVSIIKSGHKKLLTLNRNKIPDSQIKKQDDQSTVYLSKTSSDSIAEPAALNSVAKNYGSVSTIMESGKKNEEVKDKNLARSTYKSLPGNYIKGVVTDEKGNPIPNAAVSIKGAKKSVVTDQTGFFKLYTIDPEFANQIIVNSVGYESFSEKLNSDSSYTNLIQLTKTSTALNELVIKKISIEPAIGWDAFRNYINSNKKILTVDSVLKGDEVISFVVNNKSELSAFKIEKSVSPAHDAEIIRLIKTAPPLTIIKGKKKRLRISISFN
jgi:CarboxypepD_reg-like domain